MIKKLKSFALFVIFFLVCILTLDACDYYKNKEAYDAKEQIVDAVNSGFKEQKPIQLDNIGGVKWEKVCFISYELNGIDVADGLDIPVRYVKIPRTAFSQVANEYYTEFKRSNYGLVFFSIEQKIFVAISFEDVRKTPASECHDAKNLLLLNEVTPEGRNLTLREM